eukprot:TRINITY_DN10888_c0_g1_i1.p1 TRINITY_DN10888_c0_g1~~TRINITY_DN10888_c0_g1_i1.p1  ORF type:complete len:367 (-),score=40.50 TRINITY_DN10888_c0_g1_i1:251-1318(-)
MALVLAPSFLRGFSGATALNIQQLRASKSAIAIVTFKFTHKSVRSSAFRLQKKDLLFFSEKNYGVHKDKRLFCVWRNKDDKPQEDIQHKGLKKANVLLSYRWDVPWDWKATLLTMLACGLSFVLTGLVELVATSLFQKSQSHLMNLDEEAIILFADQFLITTVGLSVINLFVNPYKPLPKDLFRYEFRDPLDLGKGWLLWGAIGIFAATIGVALAGAAVTALNGEHLQREVDSLVLLLPLIGSSNTSTVCLLGITGILAPIFEETVFRGYLMASLTKWFPTYVAVLLSAGVFALAHFTPGGFPQLFVLGTILGFGYAQTQNLLTPIAIHAFWNSGVIILLTFLKIQGYDIQEFIQ